MRYLMPTALAAAAIVPFGAASARAEQHHRRQPPQRAAGHVALHLSRHDLLVGRRLLVRGRLRPAGRRRVKVVVHGRSDAVAATVSGAGGGFHVALRLDAPGSESVRAYGAHDRRVTGSASPARRVTVYRPAAASYYGPGLYGGALACGGTLEPGTLGVANRSLPCGARVKLRYHGRNLTVPVVDRGPYSGGRVFDLTAATKARLGFPDVGVVLANR